MSKGPYSAVLPMKKIVPSRGYQLMISRQPILEEESNVATTAYGTRLECCRQPVINSRCSVLSANEICPQKNAPLSITG